MKIPKLKPCPFCGREAALLKGTRFSESWYVECSYHWCHISTRLCPTPEIAARRWNRRCNNGTV